MDRKYLSETILNDNNCQSVTTELFYFDDNVQYRNIPLSGSMSKSLKALNSYVKKNIFYDESEDQQEVQDDSAYFSKESSPNDSVSKCDSDSVKSDRIEEKQDNLALPLSSELSVISINDPTTLTDDYKFNNLLKNTNTSEVNNSNLEKNEPKLLPTNKQNESTIPVAPKRTASFSCKIGPKLNNDNVQPNNVDYHNNVTLRNKSHTLKTQENRHTVHNFTEWGNRTDIYPDVYAPLPYKSPSRRYVESDVNIHYRCPVRHDPLPLVPERELARQQAEHMKRLYREQKRNKYLQENDIRAADIEAFDASIKELQDMQNRRHQDNFMPSQKTVVPLNRYDEAEKIIAKALYTFNGQTARELSFRKGDIINVRKQIDSNWYEGEVHGKIGLFPYNYVELLKGDGLQTLKKSAVIEGRARAKFDFIAQTNLELPLKKGEVVVLTRRIDHNWWEGRNGNKTGIFPDSYVTILQEPSQSKSEPHPILNTSKPVASPAAHGLLNGADKRSMGAHRYTPQPNSPALANAPPATQPLAGYVTKSSHSLSASDRGYGPPTGAGVDLNNTEPLYVDTNAEAVPYRAMYKYRPQNPDELELNEGDTVYVLEKCDDGWYVGSSQRTGRFGTFPGNYVERI